MIFDTIVIIIRKLQQSLDTRHYPIVEIYFASLSEKDIVFIKYVLSDYFHKDSITIERTTVIKLRVDLRGQHETLPRI